MNDRRMQLIEYFITKCSMDIKKANTLADMNNQLKQAMLNKEVRFCFRKNDGNIRHAIGTLKEDLLPTIKGNGKPTPIHLQLYFDMEKKSFRSFKKEYLISVQL